MEKAIKFSRQHVMKVRCNLSIFSGEEVSFTGHTRYSGKDSERIPHPDSVKVFVNGVFLERVPFTPYERDESDCDYEFESICVHHCATTSMSYEIPVVFHRDHVGFHMVPEDRFRAPEISLEFVYRGHVFDIRHMEVPLEDLGYIHEHETWTRTLSLEVSFDWIEQMREVDEHLGEPRYLTQQECNLRLMDRLKSLLD